MRASSIALALLLGCAVPGLGRPPSDGPGAAVDAAPRAVLARFVAAVEAARWPEAYALLTSRWRGRLTPARLASDFAESGPMGRAAAGRVQGLLSAGVPLAVRDGTATLKVGGDRSVVLLLEDGSWKVDALE